MNTVSEDSLDDDFDDFTFDDNDALHSNDFVGIEDDDEEYIDL